VCPEDGFRTVSGSRYVDVPEDPLIGRVFQDRYRIDEKIGEGGMGAVYRALQLTVNRWVALKVLRRSETTDLKDVARFQQEARAVASLQHPNTVGLIDYGETEDGIFFLVMDLVEGCSLKETIRDEAPLSLEGTAHIIGQIAESLAEAHSRGIVHRDLKPGNILLTDLVGRPDFVKVVDFGIAKVSGPAAADTQLTAAGLAMGSPRYMSPEQATASPITAQSDVYSLGTIFYELLTGEPLFTCEQATEYLIAHLREEPMWPRVGGRRLEGPLVELCMACLAKLPSARPQGASAVLEAIQAATSTVAAEVETRGEAPEPYYEAQTLDISAMEARSPTTTRIEAESGNGPAPQPAGAGRAERRTIELSPDVAVQDDVTISTVRDAVPVPAAQVAAPKERAAPGAPLPGQHMAVSFSSTLVDLTVATDVPSQPMAAATMIEGVAAPGPRVQLQTGHPEASSPLTPITGMLDGEAPPTTGPRWTFLALLVAGIGIGAGALWGVSGGGGLGEASSNPTVPAAGKQATGVAAQRSEPDYAPVRVVSEGATSGFVLIGSEPMGARVILNGKEVGTTPMELAVATRIASLILVHPDRQPSWIRPTDLRDGVEMIVLLHARH
jgi:serine/threonine protein kinase